MRAAYVGDAARVAWLLARGAPVDAVSRGDLVLNPAARDEGNRFALPATAQARWTALHFAFAGAQLGGAKAAASVARLVLEAGARLALMPTFFDRQTALGVDVAELRAVVEHFVEARQAEAADR
jgi:hypothetical protein